MKEKWKRVEELFNAALELEPTARAPFLNEACAGDEELQRDLETCCGGWACRSEMIGQA